MLRVFISTVHIELLFQICAIHVHWPAYRRQWSKNTRRSRSFTLVHWRKWRRNTKHFASWWVINSSRQILVAWPSSPGCGVFLVVAKDDINRWNRDQNGFVSFNASFFREEHFFFNYQPSRLALKLMKWAVYNFSGLHSWNDPKVYQYPNTLSHHVHTSIIFNKEAFFELILNGTAMCVISWGIQIFQRKTVLIQAHSDVCCILKRTSVCVNQSLIMQRRTDSYQRTQMYVASSNELQCTLIIV